MPVQWYNGKVVRIQQLSVSTRQFTVQIPEEDGVFHFMPGQFVTMDLPVSEKRLFRWRSYSIANRPDESNLLEFCIVRSDNGLGTKYLFDNIILGSIIKFKGPDGGFVLPDDLTKEIIMICTGTGIAPFRSMIQHVIAQKLSFRSIHVIFGTRSEENILYRNEFEKIVKEIPAIRYSVALSREEKPDFHFGYVHDIYLKDYHVINTERQFYICGWTKMIDEAVANLLINMKYDKTQIHYELYG